MINIKKATERKYYILWNGLLLISILYTFINSTITVVFAIKPTEFTGLLDLIICSMFALDTYFKLKLNQENSFYNQFKKNNYGRFENSYPVVDMLIDFFSVIPWEFIVFFLPDQYDALRLLIVLRACKIHFMFNNINKNPLGPGSIKSLVMLVTIFCSIQAITCLWLGINGFEGKDWVTDYNKAVYWTITTLTTIGYGDITPSTNIGRFYTMIIMILGVGTYGFIIANVSRLILNADKNKEAKKEKLHDITLFMTHYSIPQNIQKQVYLYYHNLFDKRLSDGDSQLINELPQALQNDINIYMRIKLIRSLTIFSDMNIACLKMLSNSLELMSFSPGEKIISKGEVGQEMFIINHGEVEVCVEEQVVATFGAGHFFGEIALMENVTRTADVRSKSYAELYSLNKEHFQQVIERFPLLKEKFLKKQIVEKNDKSTKKAA
jgi:voltage-gated potassium channel